MELRATNRILCGAILMIASMVFWSATATAAASTTSVANIWTEPASGYGFLDSAIDSARHSIDLSMYELSDLTLEHDLVARAAAGVDVRVLLDADYEGTKENASAYAMLHAGKVHVEWAPSGQIFHAKYVVIDGRDAYVGTGNLQSYYYATTRDFWVEVTNASDVRAMQSTFSTDFAHSAVVAAAPGLVWSPGSTGALVALIASARHTLLVENEEMDSASIEAALAAASHRGVVVKVVMTESSSWNAALEVLAQDGVRVRVLSSLQVYIHAKVICADCVGETGTVFIGSENFSTSSLSYNRELGVLTTTPAAIHAVETAVNDDFARGTTVAAPVTRTTSGALRVTSYRSTIAPGEEDSLSVHAPHANEECELVVTLPSGHTSESRGLGPARANSSESVTWTWKIGTRTGAGAARATVTCGPDTLGFTFEII